MPSRHLCPQCLLESFMFSWGSFSYFDPEHKASFVLRIKGVEVFEEQGSISWHALQLFVVCMFFMYIMTKINFCYHTTVLAIWFSILWQFDNSSSWTCSNIAQCTVGIGLHFFILVLSISHAVCFSYNSTILKFSYNFSLAPWSLLTLFVSLFILFVVVFFFTLFSSD